MNNNHQSRNTLDILAFGAHADDVEIGMAGTIAKFQKLEMRIGICDLTEAELSSNGDVETRYKEAEVAATILGVKTRVNLKLPDRGLLLHEEWINKVSYIIRKYRPRIVFSPFLVDRHPDHGNCTRIIEEAIFSAGINKYKVQDGLPAHKVNQVFYYFINGFHTPQFVVDISSEMDIKVQCLQAYKSQFIKSNDSFETPLVNGYIDTVKSRDKLFGTEVGVQYAEGFVSKKPLLVGKSLLGEII
jgi:N-acetylglucosamine malate deacetylase 1